MQVLTMIIICGLLLGAGAGATYEIRHFAKRLDTGQPIQTDTSVEVQDTNCPVDLTLLGTSFVWMTIPMQPKESVTLSRPIHPVVVIQLDSTNGVWLSLTNDADWETVQLSYLMPCDSDGLPLNWDYHPNGEKIGVVIDLYRSSNLVDWDYIAEMSAPVSFRDLDSNIQQGQQYYRTITP